MSTKLAHYGEWAAMVAALPTGALRCKGEAPMIRVVITTYGTLHGPAPAEGDALLVDLSNALRNPHQDPALRYRTGLDPEVRAHVLETPGADRVVSLNVDRIRALNTVHTMQVQPILTRVHVACRGGRHRSVAVAEEIARELRREGIGVEVYHRDINKPVVEN